MKVSTAIASILNAEETEYLFCFPVNPLIDACAGQGIRPIVTRTERTLINMADGYSRATNGVRLGVAAVQHGPGAENAFAGVAQAFADGSPLLFLPGGYARGRAEVLPNFDATANYQGVAKWTASLSVPARVPEMFRRAYTLLRTGRRAPVVLELPADVAAEEIEAPAYTVAQPVRSAGDPAAVREAVRLLLRAKRPVLHAGQGVLWAEAWDELRELAELLSIPVMTTLTGKSAFPEDHPLALGTGGHSGTAMAHHFLQQADLILGIGCSFTSTVFAAPIPAGKTVIHVTNSEGDLQKDLPADHAILGDAKLVLGQLLEEAKREGSPAAAGSGPEEVAREIRAVREVWMEQWLPKLTSNEVPINPYRVIHELMRLVDRRRAIVTHDSGTPRDQLAPFWETRVPRGYLGWGKSTQLGSSLGFALGAKLAAPDRWVIHFLGDTALGMCGMDLETAARERIPILTILVNNGLMGGYGRYIPVATEKYRSRYLSGDYSRVAEALGVVAERVTHPSEIVPALKHALAVTAPGGDPAAPDARPALVEFITREETDLSRPW
jgi:thiamine pyrophosphate-dependent acetolactate synthase large subunit-like protein